MYVNCLVCVVLQCVLCKIGLLILNTPANISTSDQHSDVGFSTLHNADKTSVPDVEITKTPARRHHSFKRGSKLSILIQISCSCQNIVNCGTPRLEESDFFSQWTGEKMKILSKIKKPTKY